ncbi:MAG: queuine tRNA-ribosyltransferase family protein [Puniceicoccales bacterium]|nr:queuine tRNA-ribosyltransferase family protein [Puniceicoccales bacterium]MDR2435871.1 queuine tRNA-ribosyltransferase family protein [Puniceicoccales bacterium]
MFKAKESVGGQLLTIHNAHFMVNFMKQVREMIAKSEI